MPDWAVTVISSVVSLIVGLFGGITIDRVYIQKRKNSIKNKGDNNTNIIGDNNVNKKQGQQ